MPAKTVVLINRLGLHARPAALIAKTACLYDCSIMLRTQKRSCSAKSIIALMTMAVHCGESLTIETDGPNADEALDALVALVESRFGEEE